jgi:hypothetical protein
MPFANLEQRQIHSKDKSHNYIARPHSLDLLDNALHLSIEVAQKFEGELRTAVAQRETDQTSFQEELPRAKKQSRATPDR